MKNKNETFVAPVNDPNTQLHIDPIECYGCHKLFSLTVRDDPFEYKKKYCAICFGHLFSISDFQKVIMELDPIQRILWEVPTKELPDDIKKLVHTGD